MPIFLSSRPDENCNWHETHEKSYAATDTEKRNEMSAFVVRGAEIIPKA